MPLEERTLGSTAGDVTSFLATGLIPAQQYTFSVVAINEVGTSPCSAPLAEAYRTPPGVPEPPEAIQASPLSTTELRLEWAPPARDNGAPVTGYHIEVFLSGEPGRELVSQMVIPASEREVIVQTLEPETDYEYVLPVVPKI